MKSRFGHRRFRFSLRSLIALFTIVVLSLGILGVWGHRARERRLAANRIELIGGNAWWHVPSRKHDETIFPEWLTRRFPPEYFGYVSNVSIPNATDGQLDLLRVFTNLRSLHLADSKVSNDGLGEVACNGNLTRLYVDSSGVSDKGLIHLKRLRRLKYLTLRSNNILGQGLQHLSELEDLDSVTIESPGLTDDGIQHLAELGELECLKGVVLYASRITEQGVLSLAERLEHCQIMVIPPPGTVVPSPDAYGTMSVEPYFGHDPEHGFERLDANSIESQ